MPNPTPQAVIGLKLDSIGLDQAAQGAEKLTGHLQNVTKEITTIGVGIGVGGLLRDFVAIEGSAARTASYMGSITGGMSGYSGLAQTALGVQARTGVSAGQTLGAAAMIASLTGGRGLQGNPGAQAGLLGALGMYGAAYQINPTELASSLGPLLQSAGLNGAAGKPMLNMLAGSAIAGGMGNNFPSYLAGVSSMATSAVATNPGLSKYGGAVAQGLSTMYNQAAAGNPAYLNNPSLFQSGETAVSSSLQGAYQNPRMMLALEAMGINYWDARQGLAGPQGQLNAAKILKYSAEQFGEGTTYQDAWLRANFGELNGTEALRAIAAGKKAGAGGASQAQRMATQGIIGQRVAQGSTTPGANLERARGGIEHGVFGAAGGALNGLFGLQAENPFGALAASYGAMKLLGKGGGLLRGLFSRLGGGAAADAGGGLASAGLGGLAAIIGGGALGGGISLGVGELFKEMGLGSSLAKASEQFFNNPLGTLAEAGNVGWHDLFGGGNLWEKRAKEHNRAGYNYPGMKSNFQRAGIESILKGAEKKFGSGFYHMDAGGESANKWIEQQEHVLEKHGGATGLAGPINEAIQNAREYSTLGAQGYSTKKFGDAVTEFGSYVKSLKGGGTKTTSYLQSFPGSNNAAGLQDVSSMIGGSMALAHSISAAMLNSGGGAPMATPTSNMGGGSTRNVSAVSGSGWAPCTLTYYQPSAGGINGKSGGGAWSGHPVYDSTWGCAAPPAFAFGTQIAFSYGGKEITVQVVDRGGAITGTHFDLLPGPARALGMMAAGRVTAGYKVMKGAANPAGQPSGSSLQTGTTPTEGFHAQMASFQGSAHTTSAVAMGMGGAPTPIHVHIDGRLVERQRRLVRGARA